MRDQDRVIARVERAVLLDEIEQIGHLLEVRRHMRIVAGEVDVVEFHVDNMLDFSRGRVELASGMRRSREPHSQQPTARSQARTTAHRETVLFDAPRDSS